MQKGNLNNLKHKEAYEFYNSYSGEKVKYYLFMQRIKLSGYDFQTAIKPGHIRLSGKIKENGRICNICGDFKEWIDFHKSDRHTSTGYTGTCRECRNKRHADYRKTERGKMMTKNHHIIYRANLLKREQEKRKYREWQIKNAEVLKEKRRKWNQDNRKAINERRNKRNAERYCPGEKVIFEGNIYKILDVKHYQGCLLQINPLKKVWISKSKLKPVLQKDKRSIMDLI